MDELILEPGRTSANYWRNLWRYRELFAFMAWRDVLVRYKQTVLGVSWAIIQPLVTMLIFTLVFGRLARLPSDGAPYPILVFSALLPWQLFSAAVISASNSMVGNAGILGKLYFPRLIVPTSAVITSLLDFLISLALLGVLMVWFGFAPSWRIVTLPLFALLALGAALGLGIWTAALNVRYRDFRYVVPFVLQAGMYISPVGFSSSIVPASWRPLFSLNPMASVIDGFRWAIVGGASEIYVPGFVFAVAVVFAFLWIGIRYFRATERTMADVI